MSFHFDENDNDSGLHLESNSKKAPEAVNPFAKKAAPAQPAASEPQTPAQPTTQPGSLPFRKPVAAPAPATPSFTLPSRPLPKPQTAQVPTPQPAAPQEPAYNPLAAEIPSTQEEYIYTPPAATPPTPAYQQVMEEVAPAEPASQYDSRYTQPQQATPVPQQSYQQPAQGYQERPVPQSNFQPPAPVPMAVEPANGRNKRAKNQKPQKEGKKQSDYAGKRGNIFWLRMGVILVAVVLMGAGLKTLILPSGGPTPEQVAAKAQEATNYTGFPTESGAVFATEFTRLFMTYTSEESSAERAEKLKDYASETLITKFDITRPSREEYEAANAAQIEAGIEVPDYNEVIVDQIITEGPYVVVAENLTATQALYTLKFRVNDGKWTYLQVPVKYDEKTFAMTIAGPPSFTKPVQNVGTTKEGEYTVNFTADQELIKSFQPDLESYLTAWAQSDTTIISRYVVDDATQDAMLGLQGVYEFKEVNSLTIEAADEAVPKTATSRRAEFTVTWVDPETSLSYTQQYRMLLTLNEDNKWSVYDIQNFSILN